MTNYTTPWLASLALLVVACDPPSTNVGEVPTTTEAATDGDAETDASSLTSDSTGAGGSGTGGSIGAEETSAAPESTGGTEETGDQEGSCLDDGYDCFDGVHEPFECGAELACDVLEVNDPSLNEFDPDPFGFVNPDAAACILEGLAAGSVGAYEIEVEPGQQNSISHRLEVLADGSVLFRRDVQQDKTCDGHEARLERQPASYFESCMMETDEALILACVLGAGDAEQCVPDGLVCPA